MALNFGLPSLLILLVGITHIGYDVLASFYPEYPRASAAWFYILRGVEGTILYCIVWALTPWRPAHVRLAVSVACAWGALEEFQTAACRFALGFDKVPTPGPYQGLCDVATGWPVYALTLMAVLLVFASKYTKK